VHNQVGFGVSCLVMWQPVWVVLLGVLEDGIDLFVNPKTSLLGQDSDWVYHGVLMKVQGLLFVVKVLLGMTLGHIVVWLLTWVLDDNTFVSWIVCGEPSACGCSGHVPWSKQLD